MIRDILIEIALKAGLFSNYRTSTKEMAQLIGCSQQSASRIMIEMEKKGVIKRNVSTNGMDIWLTEKGRNILESKYDGLKKIFLPINSLTGIVFKGIGEGEHYVKKYSAKIKAILGFTPFPGTLNLKVDIDNVKKFFVSFKGSKIESFKIGNRTYGSITLFLVTIDNIKAAIIRAERSHYDEDTLELISPVCLRDILGVKDGDKIKIMREW